MLIVTQDSWSIVVPYLQSEFPSSLDRIDTDWLGCDTTVCKSASLAIHTVSLTSPALEVLCADTSFNSFNIRVNTIVPGIFPSEMTGVSSKPDLSDLIESNPQAAKAVARCPAGRAGVETEIVGPCLLLASPAGGYMNNARLTIDGGRLMAAGSNDGVRMEDWTYV